MMLKIEKKTDNKVQETNDFRRFDMILEKFMFQYSDVFSETKS